MSKKPWYKSKTIGTAIVTIVGALVGMSTDAVTWQLGVQTIVGALMAIFIRTGVEGAKGA
ncbi:hypothetical protein ACFLT7_07220 [candidate division KSB1 bacterium]